MSRQIGSPQSYTCTSESVLELFLSKLTLTLFNRVLPEDYCKEDPRNFP